MTTRTRSKKLSAEGRVRKQLLIQARHVAAQIMRPVDATPVANRHGPHDWNRVLRPPIYSFVLGRALAQPGVPAHKVTGSILMYGSGLYRDPISRNVEDLQPGVDYVDCWLQGLRLVPVLSDEGYGDRHDPGAVSAVMHSPNPEDRLRARVYLNLPLDALMPFSTREYEEAKLAPASEGDRYRPATAEEVESGAVYSNVQYLPFTQRVTLESEGPDGQARAELVHLLVVNESGAKWWAVEDYFDGVRDLPDAVLDEAQAAIVRGDYDAPSVLEVSRYADAVMELAHLAGGSGDVRYEGQEFREYGELSREYLRKMNVHRRGFGDPWRLSEDAVALSHLQPVGQALETTSQVGHPLQAWSYFLSSNVTSTLALDVFSKPDSREVAETALGREVLEAENAAAPALLRAQAERAAEAGILDADFRFRDPDEARAYRQAAVWLIGDLRAHAQEIGSLAQDLKSSAHMASA